MPHSKKPFALFNEKVLSDDVSIISWCPTADLVLLVSHQGLMTLYRNEHVVNKIWSLASESDSQIKIVTWKPNGKEFVIGHEDGTVYRIDITYHKPRIFRCWKPSEASFASITSLIWIDYELKKKQMDIEGFDIHAFDLESELPGLSQIPPEEPVSHLLPRARKKVQLPIEPPANNELQSLLFIGNSEGKIHIILNGIYPIGSCNLSEEYGDTTILDISIPENISSLLLLTKSTKYRGNNFTLQVIDTQFLEDQKEQIFSISEIQTKLNYLLEYTRLTIDVLKRHHASYTRLTKNVAQKAADSIINHNEHSTAMPEVELTGTLAIGSVSENLQDFFVEYLTPAQIRTWETQTTHGYQNSLKVVCEHILPACERIQLELSKLLGYSLWTQKYGDFLESYSVQACIHVAVKLVKYIHKFTRDLNTLSTHFQAFVKWITVVSLKVTDPNSVEYQNESSLCEDPELVLKFLNEDFIKDSLEKFFSSSAEETRSLPNILQKLCESCSLMLEKPSSTVSEKLGVVSKAYFSLNKFAIEEHSNILSYTAKDTDNAQCNYNAFLLTNSGSKLIIIKNAFLIDTATEYALVNIEGDITDMKFFDGAELGLCLQLDEENSQLATISLAELEFEALNEDILNCTNVEPARSLLLPQMIDVKLGCNGLPKRRILSVIASNGLMKIYSMEEEEEEEEVEEDETEESSVVNQD